MALDPSFDTDALAKALGIPSHKHMLHQHLYEEMRSLAILHRYDWRSQQSSPTPAPTPSYLEQQVSLLINIKNTLPTDI